MAVEITKLNEDELLSALGDGDWVIAMPEGYPDLQLSTQWRDEVVTWAGTRFVRWVLSGSHIEIDYENDPPWDHSGNARHQNADPLLLRTLYDTLAAWLEDEYTGQWTATFESGYGKSWETYGDRVEEQVRDRLTALFRSQYADQFAAQPDELGDEVWDDVDLVKISLEQAILMIIRRIPCAAAWQQFEPLTQQQLAQEKRLAAERAVHYASIHAQAQQFWDTYFSDLQRVRIDQPQFRQLRIAERLRECFLDADPDVIAAIVEVGLPGNFSNRVSEAVKTIARDALC